MEKKTKILITSVALTLVVLFGIAAMAYANSVSADTSTTADATYNDNGHFFGRYGRGIFSQGAYGLGCGEPITVSQEFKGNVINIAKNDTDVQNLLNDGYNITAVKPIIIATVQGDGTITMKAANAVIVLQKNKTGRAFVWVSLEEAKVTRIEILTRTVIEKP